MARRALFVVGCLLALGIALGAGIAAAHGNHATAHAQVSANGTLVVEQVFLMEPGYLVVRADDNGTPGEVLGTRSLGRGLHTGVSVGIDGPHWQTLSGNTTVWTVLHTDNGDDEFDTGEDELLSWLGKPAGESITVGKRSGAGYVVTGGRTGNTTGELLVSRVALPESGHVVVHERVNDSLGPVRGSQSLSAGAHEDVRVPINLSEPRSEWPGLSVVIYTDDGDGAFDSDDSVVRVGGEPVGSPLGSTAGNVADSPAVNTPVPTTDTTTSTSERGNGTATPTTTGSTGSGFGFGVALVALALVLLTGRR